MKKFGEIILIVITVLGLPAILQLSSTKFYNSNETIIWISSIVLALILSITQVNIKFSPFLNRLFRRFRFYIFKTKNIAIILITQLAIVLFLLLTNIANLDSKTVLISFGINLLGINLLIIVGKLSNTDSKELVLHDTNTGKMYLFSNNQLRHVPDPPTFDLFGLSWSDAIDISDTELKSYKIAPPITSIKDMKLVQFKGRVYGLVNDKLKHVPDITTLNYILNNRTNKDIETLNDLQGYTKDKSFVRTI